MLRVFGRTRFRILQGCNPPDTIFLLALLLRPFGVRFIFDHHDLTPELLEAKFKTPGRLFSALTRLAERLSFRVASVSIATNESFKEIAISRGDKPPDRVFVVRNCPDLTRLGPLPNRKGPGSQNHLQVVYVGFMASQDGLDLLLSSIEHIVKHERRQDTKFMLVGGGTALAELRSIASEKGLDCFVTFTGHVSHDDVIKYLSDADIGVAPDPKTSMNDNSTMIKILEYGVRAANSALRFEGRPSFGGPRGSLRATK